MVSFSKSCPLPSLVTLIFGILVVETERLVASTGKSVNVEREPDLSKPCPATENLDSYQPFWSSRVLRKGK